MARSKGKSAGTKEKSVATGEARFPYTTKPSSLRRMLQTIPTKPRPPKLNSQLLKSWGFADTNDLTILRVLKAVGLLSQTNEPTDAYASYMNLQTGSAALAEPVRRVYAPLFQASHAPYRDPPEQLKNLFNINSGGGERSIDFQIATFKALCESTNFDIQAGGTQPSATTGAAAGITAAGAGAATAGAAGAATIHIDLHIHLPENKTRRDYEAMIEDIGKFIFGRPGGGARNE